MLEKLHLTSRREKVLFFLRLAGYLILAVIFLANVPWYVHTTATGTYIAKKWLILIFGTSLIMIFLPCFKWRKIDRNLHYFLNIPLIAAGICLTYAMGEFVMKFYFWKKPMYRIVINLLLIFCIFLIFYVITNKVKKSLFVTYCILVGFGILNYFIYEFRGEPINAADIFVVGTALNVAGDYTFDINRCMFAGLFVGFSFGSFLLWLPEDIPYKKGLKRLYLAIPALVFVFCTGYIFTLSEWPNHIGIKVRVFDPYAYYRRNGEALNFIRGFYYMKQDKPDGYSPEYAQLVMDRSGYSSDPVSADPSEYPNVIVVMNESLSDFTGYDNVELSEDPLKYLHSLEKSSQAIRGNLSVDVFGGRTANTEYEFQTGNSTAFLPGSAVPYALYVRSPQPSITWNMRDMGFTGDNAFHPYKANGYSRPRAYPNLGFKNFISIESIEGKTTDSDFVRDYISDDADFRWIENMYEEEQGKDPDKPFYLFNVTMQNHGGFDQDFDNFKQNISVSGLFADDAAFKRYINLTNYTDKAFEKLTAYFSKVKRPTIIVMFGDHRPNLHNHFYDKLYGKKSSQLKGLDIFQHYQTPFVIWANYDINPDGKYNKEYKDISINYLSSAVMKLAGLPQTAYQKYLNDMRKDVPVFTKHGYIGSDGKYYKRTDKLSPYYEKVNTYHMLEYNYQFDAKNRNDAFFELQSDDHALQELETKED